MMMLGCVVTMVGIEEVDGTYAASFTVCILKSLVWWGGNLVRVKVEYKVVGEGREG
jgi:hypothetical protein